MSRVHVPVDAASRTPAAEPEVDAAHAGTAGNRPGSLAHPHRAVVGWTTRLVRRGTLLLAGSAAAYMVMEVASYASTYPNGVSAKQFAIFVDNPAARMLQGVPHGLDTAGGFAAWDGGWVIELVMAVWAVLVVSRLLRGEEDSERAELLLVGPARVGRLTALILLVVASGGLLTGLAVTLALVGAGSAVTGSTLFGLGLAGFTATFVGVGAVASQVVDVRRRAVGFASTYLGAAFLLRMVANSTDGRSWLGWLTPFGWMDHLESFGDPQPPALVLLLVTPGVLLAVTVRIRDGRDMGCGLVTSRDSRKPRLGGLGSPAAFAWRSNQTVLTGWVVGLGAYAFVLGSLVTTMIDFLSKDKDYQRLLARMGLRVALTADGFLGVMSVTLGVGFSLYAAWRVGAVRAEEESGRADNILTRPVTRTRWLTDQVGLTLVGAALLVVLTGLALWAGAVAAGSHDVSVAAALRSVLNTGSLVVLVTGLAVLAFGVLPRLTIAVPAAVTVGGYVLTLLGPALSWPGWVVDLSPFTHLAYVPAEPFAVTGALLMAAIGLAAAAAGVVAFGRRDITGA